MAPGGRRPGAEPVAGRLSDAVRVPIDMLRWRDSLTNRVFDSWLGAVQICSAKNPCFESFNAPGLTVTALNLLHHSGARPLQRPASSAVREVPQSAASSRLYYQFDARQLLASGNIRALFLLPEHLGQRVRRGRLPHTNQRFETSKRKLGFLAESHGEREALEEIRANWLQNCSWRRSARQLWLISSWWSRGLRPAGLATMFEQFLATYRAAAKETSTLMRATKARQKTWDADAGALCLH
uniref:Uncharacterized protein n=1 Tax=Macrostomum lignano TaxID=282301 RepID=A0A1I8FJC6_9PLAT